MRLLASGLACIVAAATLSSPAIAEDGEAPSWSRPPDPDIAALLMPGFANWLGIAGSASVACYATADGHPFQCGVLSETPEGLGFGSAARLVVASGQLRLRRVDGVTLPGQIRTTVRFSPPPEEKEPSSAQPLPPPEKIMLAREVVENVDLPWPTVADSLDGLDVDRREVVAEWVRELFFADVTARNEISAVQFARLFSEEELRRMLRGERVNWPTNAEFLAAAPATTASDRDAVREVRRRYCERYDCGEHSATVPPSLPDGS